MKVEKYLPHILIASGAIGLLAALALSIEKISILKDPAKQLGCDLNPVIACGSVINTDQASAFGFSNPFLGLAGFGGLLAIGLAVYTGAKLSRNYWRFILAGLLAATVFVHWLFFETVYRIGALCPYCMVVWVVTITSFWYVFIYSLDKKIISVPKSLKKASVFVKKHHLDILIVWFLIIIVLILNHFWYYWKTLL